MIELKQLNWISVIINACLLHEWFLTTTMSYNVIPSQLIFNHFSGKYHKMKERLGPSQ